jgi:hypothetical protein
MTRHLFQDVYCKNVFKPFFGVGERFDANFIYNISFGLIPRQYLANHEDRYILEQEGDVTEITFMMSGTYGIAFNIFSVDQMQLK